MWEKLKSQIIAYRNNVSDEVAQDAYDVVLGDMEQIEQQYNFTLVNDSNKDDSYDRVFVN